MKTNEDIVSADQSITDLASLLDYLSAIRLIEVEGRFDGQHLKSVRFVSLYRTRQAIVLASSAYRKAAVDADNKNIYGCIRVYLREAAIEFLPHGFRTRGLQFRYLEQPHSTSSTEEVGWTITPVPKITPKEQIDGIGQLGWYLHPSPYLVVIGDHNGNHFQVSTIRLEVSPLHLFLYFRDGKIVQIPCPPIEVFRFQANGFSIGRLAFYFTVDPYQFRSGHTPPSEPKED